jgi:Leucine-rich repeat (LRR) protein
MTTPETALQLIRKAAKEKAEFLDLGNCGLTQLPAEISTLSSHLRELNLGNNYSDEEMEYAITGNEGVSNNFGNFDSISTVLALNRLNSFQANSCHLNETAILKITEHFALLKKLSLSDNKMTDRGAIAIAVGLKRLQVLDLSDNNIGDNGVVAISSHLKKLQFVNFRDNAIGDNGAKAISKNLKQLSKLWLWGNQIGDEGAIAIANNFKNFQELDLSNNQIGDNGVIAIANNLRRLKVLDLSNNSIGDNGAISIARNLKQLTALALSNNNVGDNGVIALGKSLKQLEYLDLHGNEIGDKGAACIAKNLTELMDIDLLDNPIEKIPEGILDDAIAFRNFFTEQRVANDSVKLILLGNTEAGKSELAHVLSKDKINPKSQRTHGIKQWIWREKHNSKKYYWPKVNIYDFGGQDYYHATHHLFFSHSSLYVVLWHTGIEAEMSSEEGQYFDLPYWLGNIKYLLYRKEASEEEKANTAIWAVQNKGDLDGQFREIPDTRLKREYHLDPNGSFFLSITELGIKKNGRRNGNILNRTCSES